MAKRNEKSDMQKRRDEARQRSKQRAEDRETSGGGGSTLTLPDGTENFEHSKKFAVDILPFLIGSGPNKGGIDYVVNMLVHVNVGPEDRWRLCRKMLGSTATCPICETRTQMTKDGAPDEDIKALKPKKRTVFNVIDKENPDKGVQVWEISYFNFMELLLEEIDYDNVDEGFFLDVDGSTLNLRFKEASMGSNKYLKASRIDAEERKDYGEDVYKKTVDLVSALKILSYEELHAEFHGMEAEAPDKEEAPELVQTEETYSGEPAPEKPAAEPEVVDAEKEKPTPAARPAARPRRGKTKEEGPVCPEGFTFGTDYDTDQKKCDACAIWPDCNEAYEAAQS